MFQLSYGALVHNVAGVQRGSRFEQKKPAFFVGDGTVLDSARHHDELACLDPFMAVAKFHAEAAFDYQEHFIFVFVVVEDEFALEFVELDRLPVQFGSDVGLPVFGNLGKFFGDVDFVHGVSSDDL
ncbi:hypothetical protein SBA2_40003 [Acidobacteriia bacterium SbA2]|nr:hypothetical protein SBA2_40003 [Acidobacteriia bacterium SbA2]